MIKEKSTSFLAIALIYISFGIVLLYQYNGSFSEDELRLFIELIACYVWTAGLLVYAKARLNLYIFEPIAFIGILYELIFVVKPIVDLKNRQMYAHGIYVFPGGEKATLLFTIGFTVLFLAYYCRIDRSRLVQSDYTATVIHEDEKFEADSKILYAAWFFIYVLCLVSMISQGLSLNYIFSLGARGDRIAESENAALLFLANFGVSLIALWLIILVKTHNTAMKLLLTFLCIVYLLMRNARWVVLIFIVSPVVYYYIKKRKAPSLLLIAVIGGIGLTVFAWMQANRAALSTGGAISGWGENGLSLDLLIAPFESDLNTYRTFYSMMERYPSQYTYMYGKTFFYTLILFFPRFLWKGKPDNPVRELIEHSLNYRARISGTAVANVGEFYANFGILGVLLGMFLLGRAARLLKEKFINQEYLSEDKCILYGILYPLLFQWIARGNFSGNFYITIFAMLPYMFTWFCDKMSRRRK